MSARPRYETLRDYLRVVRRNRLLILGLGLLFGAVAFGVSKLQQPVYETEASVEMRELSEDLSIVGDEAPQRTSPEQLAAVNAELLTREPVAVRVKKALRTPMSTDQLLALVTARAEARTNLVVVGVRTSVPQESAVIANEFAKQFVAETQAVARRRLQSAIAPLRSRQRRLARSPQGASAAGLLRNRIATLESAASFIRPARVARDADVPTQPISPKPLRNGLLGLAVGLTVGLIAAFARDALDRRLRGTRDIQDELRLPLLAQITDDGLGRAGLMRKPRGPLSASDFEGVRILRSNLRFLDPNRELRSIAVTSPQAEEGKSTVAASLAWVSAMSGGSTVLLECDFRKPALARRLGLSEGPGLVDYLRGTVELDDVIRFVDVTGQSQNGDEPGGGLGGLNVITAGTSDPRAAVMLGSDRMYDLIALLGRAHGLVVLDTSPLLPVVDTHELVPYVDGIVICVRSGYTTREQARGARELLGHFPPSPTGLVVTGVKPDEDPRYASYGYGESAVPA